MVKKFSNAEQQHVNNTRHNLKISADKFDSCMLEVRAILRNNIEVYTITANSALMELTALYDEAESPENAAFYDTIQAKLVTRLAAIDDKVIELFAHVKEAGLIIRSEFDKGKIE